MSSAEKLEWMDVATYLRLEAAAPQKSEYVDGTLRSMAGAINRHNLIATNVSGILFGQLRGKPCRAYNSDTKIRIRRRESTWFYYPDASVICLPNEPNDAYQDRPVMVVEVLSRSTRGTDLDEKLSHYLSIPSLEYFLALEQTAPQAILMCRVDKGFLRETYEGLDSVIHLPEIGCHLTLGKMYSDIDFSPEAIREELPDYAHAATEIEPTRHD
jgi:Uma2 family endonuclease